VLKVGCAGPKGADIATKQDYNAKQVVDITSFSGRMSEYLSDNIQRGALRNRMTVPRGSSSTLEEEKPKLDQTAPRVAIINLLNKAHCLLHCLFVCVCVCLSFIGFCTNSHVQKLR
jgi:hypothetical protein